MAVAILLHVPYVRRAGTWPFGEHQLFEAMADAFVPLLDAVRDSHERGVAPRFTLALSPLLAEQLADPILRGGFEQYMLRRIGQAEADLAPGGPAAVAARWQKTRDEGILESFFAGHRRDLVRSVRELERAGAIEAAGYPASGAPVPLLPRVSARRAQILQGLRSAELHLEHSIGGIWLPGGAVAPGAQGESVADLLAAHGIAYTYVGEKALRGPLGGLPGIPGDRGRSALDAHRWSDGLIALVRHEGFRAATIGAFPSHPAYFGPADPLGRRYWRQTRPPPRGAALAGGGEVKGKRRITGRATGRKVPPVAGAGVEITVAPAGREAGRPFYDPALAQAAWREHAAAAVAAAVDLLAAHRDRTGREGCLCLPVDARLFCAWPEGIAWLCEFSRQARGAGIELQSGAEAVHREALQSLPDVTPSSWEGDGDFRTWQADHTTWYWDSVAATLDHAESLSDRFGGVANPLMVRVLAQATREALLLVEAEWPDMIGRGGEQLDYAAERVRGHHDRFRRLAYMLDTGNPDEMDVPLLERYEELDNPFQAIDLGLLSSDPSWTPGEAGPGRHPWSGMGPGGVV